MKIRINSLINILHPSDRFLDLPDEIRDEIQSTGFGWYSITGIDNEIFLGNRLGFIRQRFSGDGCVEIDYATPGKGSGFIYLVLQDSLCVKSSLTFGFSSIFNQNLLASAVRLSNCVANIVGVQVIQQHTGADC